MQIMKQEHQNSSTTDQISFKSSFQCQSQQNIEHQFNLFSKSKLTIQYSDSSSCLSSPQTTYCKQLQPSYSSVQLLCQKNSFQLCKDHGLQINFWCLTCKIGACYRCCRCLKKHRNHCFQRYSQSSKKRSQKFTQCFSSINKFRQILKNHKQFLKYNLKNLGEMLNYRIKTLNNGKKLLQQQQISKKYQISQNLINSLELKRSEIKELNIKYRNLLQNLMFSQKLLILSTQGIQMQKECQSYIEKIDNFSIPVFSKCINQSIVTPPFEGISYQVLDFQEHKNCCTEIIQEFQACFGKWILKIYPAGFKGSSSPTKMKQIDYLSIYVQMLESKLQDQEYKIKVSLISPENASQKIEKQFKAFYRAHESWGYDRFIRIRSLYDKRYIGFSNNVKISVQVRLQKYCVFIKPLSQEILKKENLLKKNFKRIQDLKKILDNCRLKKQNNQPQRENEAEIKASADQNDSIIQKNPVQNLRDSEDQMIRHIQKNPQISLQNPIHSKIIRLSSTNNSLFINNHRKFLHKRVNSSF